jgi:potassium-transporting ATPase KdpC subunit
VSYENIVGLVCTDMSKADGSILVVIGKPVGSKLIGQDFTDNDGKALPQYFQSRPSVAGTNGYDPTASQDPRRQR